MTDSQDTLLEFPCDYDIKAFGNKDSDFEQTVYSLVKASVPELTTDDLSVKQSSGGRFVSVTVSIRAQSKAQLDEIYQALTDSGEVLMSL